MRVLFDSRSLQVKVHLADGIRLETLIAAIEGEGSTVEASGDRLTPDALRGFDVVVVPTRDATDGNGYTDRELESLDGFVTGGGGLLLMSNHGPLPEAPYDHTKYDRELAGAFGITIEPAWFAAPAASQLTTLAEGALAAGHPVIAGSSAGAGVRAVVTNNCCGIAAEGCRALVRLPDSIVDWRRTYDPRTHLFAGALDREGGRSGRVIVVADSGFLGSEGTRLPGPGLIGRGDNLRFVLNALLWLRGEP